MNAVTKIKIVKSVKYVYKLGPSQIVLCIIFAKLLKLANTLGSYLNYSYGLRNVFKIDNSAKTKLRKKLSNL